AGHRPCAIERCAHLDSRRGDFGTRLRIGNAGSGRAEQSDGRPHGFCYCPPVVNGSTRRRDRRPRQRRDSRVWYPRRTSCTQWHLREALRYTISRCGTCHARGGSGIMMSVTNPQPATHETTFPAKSKRALRSMTGYAQAQSIESGWTLRISIRSVNHRFLDLHVRVPEGFEPLQPRVRQIVRERVHRGHLDVTLYHELAGPAAVGVNEAVAAAYVEAVNSLRRKFEIQAEPDLASILRLPG